MPFTALNTLWQMIDNESRTILDIGSGKGEPMKFLNRQRKFYTVGIDIFEPYLKKCKESGYHNEYILCDARKLPFRRKTFDAVICTEVLEHLEREDGLNLLKMMQEIATIQVIITTPVGTYDQDPYDQNPHQEHKHIWNHQEMKALGYQVKLLGLRSIGGKTGFGSRMPKLFKPLTNVLWVIAGPLVILFPSLAGEMVCLKKVKADS
jgi:SAM-dependent methyltransferase